MAGGGKLVLGGREALNFLSMNLHLNLKTESNAPKFIFIDKLWCETIFVGNNIIIVSIYPFSIYL